MSLRNALTHDDGCEECGFQLWEPIATSTHSKLGLYNDDRFPGRCILEFTDHRQSLEDVPMDSMLGFLRDIQIAMTAIRTATGAERVNVAILGNRAPHLHAHLIPRFPAEEEYPDCSPWNDERIKGLLCKDKVETLKVKILEGIKSLDTRQNKQAEVAKQALGLF